MKPKWPWVETALCNALLTLSLIVQKFFELNEVDKMGDTCLDSSRRMCSDASPTLSSQAGPSSQNGTTDVGNDSDYDPHSQASMQTGEDAREGEGLDKDSHDKDEDSNDDHCDDQDCTEAQVLHLHSMP